MSGKAFLYRWLTRKVPNSGGCGKPRHWLAGYAGEAGKLVSAVQLQQWLENHPQGQWQLLHEAVDAYAIETGVKNYLPNISWTGWQN